MTAQNTSLYRYFVRPLLWASAIFALYLGSAGLVLPHVLHPALEQRISQALNSQARLGSLTFNPFTLTLAVTDSSISLPGNIQLRLDRLKASLSLSSLLKLAPHIGEVALDGLVMDFTLSADGTFPPRLGDQANRREAVFPFVVSNFSVNNSSIIIRDRIRDVTHVIEDIDLVVPFVSTLPQDEDIAVMPRLSATVDGRRLSLTGEAYPFSGSLRTEFTLVAEKLDLDRLRRYISPYTTLNLMDGAALSASLKLHISRAGEGPLNLFLTGGMEATNLELTGPKGTAFKAARIKASFEDLRPGRIAVKNLSLDIPEITAHRAADGNVDWQGFFAKSEGNDKVPPPAVSISKAVIRDGTVSLHDELVPGFTHTVSNIQATLLNFGSESGMDFKLEFGEGQSKFTATGIIASSHIEGNVDMADMALAPFSRHLSQATGMSLDGGIGLTGHFTVEYGARTLVRLGGVSLRNVSVGPAGSGTPLLTAGQLTVNGIVADLSARNVSVGRISGSGVSAYLVRGKDGKLALPGDVPAEKNGAPQSNWQVAIGSVRLDSASATLTDHSVRKTAVLPFSDINISASNLNTRPDRQWTATVSAKPGNRGALHLEAKGTLSPLALSFRMRAERADIAFLSPYLEEVADLSLSEGLLNGDVSGNLRTGRRGGLRIDLGGDAGLHGISLTEERREIIGWGRLRAEKFHYRGTLRRPGSLSIGNLILNGPRISLTIAEDGTNNIRRMLHNTKEPSTREASAGGFSSLFIGGIRVTSGEIRLRDERLQPPNFLRAENLGVEMGKLSSDQDSRGELAGSFRLNGSPFIFEGLINPLITPFAGALTIDISEFDLKAFSRYSVKFIGYPIHAGELSARIQAALHGLDINGRSDLAISRLDVGHKDPSSDAPDIPIRTAISLLRDLSGDITLSLPVSGRLDDPHFHIGGAINRAVANTMLRAVASPVSLIGRIFSSFVRETRQERINFAPGDDRISRRASASLHALVDSLPKHGRSKLELIGVGDMLEMSDMPTARIMRQMRMMKYDALPEVERVAVSPDRVRVGPEVDAKEYARLLREIYMAWPERPEGDTPRSAREMMRALRGSFSISDDQVNELAEARARAVRDEIVRIDTSLEKRITISPSRITPDSGEARRIDSSVLIRIR